MREAVLFILVNRENYTYSHTLVYKSNLSESIQNKVEIGYSNFEPIELTPSEYYSVIHSKVVELPANLVYKVFAKQVN